MSTTDASIAHLILHGRISPDPTHVFTPENAEDTTLPPDEPDWLLPLSTWLAHRDTLRQRHHPVGILFHPDDDPAGLADAAGRIDPQGIAYLAVDFPAYTDGRGYSIAQLLRDKHGWHGDLRARGDVMIDTVFYQARCGFDSFVVKPGHSPLEALEALGSFTRAYQRGYRAPEEASALKDGQ